MKNISVIIIALIALAFTQCKPNEDDGGEVRNVNVRCVMPIGSGERSEFANMLEDGSIKWSTGTERLYLAIPNQSQPQLVELTAFSTVQADVLAFEGQIAENLLTEGMEYEIWYLGNSKELSIPYITETRSNNILTSISGSISKQSGSIDDLGYCHIAKTTVTAKYDGEDVALTLSGTLKNLMAIAYLDLKDVVSLSGTAIKGTEYKLQYNEDIDDFEFVIQENASASIKVTEGTTKSFVVLLPNEDNDIVLECDKGSYTFENGLENNKLYYRFVSNKEVYPLEWDEPIIDDGNEGGNVNDNVVFVKGVTLNSGWYDVNKLKRAGADINMCWAASASNIIQWWQDRYVAAGNTLPAGAVTGPGTKVYPEGYKYNLALMELYRDLWDNNKGGSTDHGVVWYFEGRNIQETATAGSHAQPLSSNSGGYYSGVWNQISPKIYKYNKIIVPGIVEYNDVISTEFNNYYEWGNGSGLQGDARLKKFSDLVVEFIDRGPVSLAISLNSNGGLLHATTLWGYEIDPTTKMLTKIWITDSDDMHQGSTSGDPTQQMLREYTVSYDSTSGKVKFSGAPYGNCWAIALYPVSGYNTL